MSSIDERWREKGGKEGKEIRAEKGNEERGDEKRKKRQKKKIKKKKIENNKRGSWIYLVEVGFYYLVVIIGYGGFCLPITNFVNSNFY